MKLTILLLTTVILQLSATSFAQKITLSEKNAALTTVIEKIREQSGYDFLVTESILKNARPVNIKVRNEDFLNVLNKIFEKQSLTFVIKNNSIIVRELSKTALPLLSTPVAVIDVSGRIIDEKGRPIPGATIKIKGAQQTSVSDENGRFKLGNIESNVTLVISYIGFVTKEIKAIIGSPMTITLTEETNGLNEVVVVGYGTQKKQAITGAVSTANLRTYENVAVNNILETVKGTVAGLNVGATNTAGQLASVTIRGQNSINAGNNPLIVVDGAIFRGTLNDIPTADIESFTVLKDASAAAVYGSRSANGVILIETKKGSGIDGKPKFNVVVNQGISNELEALKVYDGPGYIQRLLDIRQANGLDADPSKIAIYLQNEEQKNYNASPDHAPTLTDPYSLFSQTGKSLNTTFSISNKTDKAQYYISGNIVDQKGVIVNDVYKHYSGRINLETDLTSWFKVGVKSYYSLKSYPGATIYGVSGGGSASSPYWFSPYASIKDADGSYKQFPQTTTSFNNPYWQLPDYAHNRQNNLNGILSAQLKAPWIKGLSYNLTYSHTLNNNETASFYGLKTIVGLPKAGSGDQAFSRSYTVMLDHLFKYNNTFGKHNIDVTALYSTENSKSRGISTHGEGFDDPSLGIYGLSKGKTQTVGTSGSESEALGEMIRVTYGFNNTYTITGTVRRDGFSAFSENNKYGTFPSVGVNWTISNEKFMKDVVMVNSLSLRVSYGQNGNQSISSYGTLGKMGTGRYFYEGSTSYVPTQFVANLGNDDLKWESTIGWDFGLDFSILKNRISGSIDYYDKYTKNLIFPLALPSTSGFSTISSNLGRVGNKGIELNLSTVNIDGSSFKWSSDIAFSLNRNKIITIYGKDKDGVEKDLISQNFFIGKSLGTIYNYQVTGMWQQSDVGNGIMTGMQPGTYKLMDVDNDGKITSDKDRVFLGNSNANFRWSLTNTFQYKDLSVMVYLYSIWGGNGYFQSGGNAPYNDGYANNAAINHVVYDYWTPSNPDAMFPRPNYANAATYRSVKYFDRSFIKLQKLSVAYNLTKLVKRYGIKGLALSFSADNLFTYAPDWIGLDPETGNGLTDTSIPSIRTFMTGLTFNF